MIDQGGDWGSGYGYGYDDSNGNGHCTTNGNANTNGGDVAHGKINGNSMRNGDANINIALLSQFSQRPQKYVKMF